MLTTSLLVLLTRDLTKLKSEITAYKSEENLWRTAGDIQNSAGNLCLHIVGNLNHFIGATLGSTGYVRQREKEFGDKNIPQKELINRITDTQKMLAKVLPALTTKDLQRDFPINVFGKPTPTNHFLLHLQSHLNYHLGQINYHRRLVDN